MWSRIIARTARAIGLELKHSQNRYFELLSQQITDGARWLDLGCGRQFVPDWCASRERQAEIARRASILAGVDLDAALAEHPLLQLRAFAVGAHLPFRDESFEIVTANMVFEHVEDPLAILIEIRRVLVPGGQLIFHTPNRRCPYIRVASLLSEPLKHKIIWWLERRSERDIFPTYYRVNTPEEIKELGIRAGLNPISVCIGGSVGVFGSYGPLGVAEVFFLRALAMPALNPYNATVLAVLQKPPVTPVIPPSVASKSAQFPRLTSRLVS
ncbi:MAG TPA: class I SAM-dependent methyltransferase [Bryobacteraceae bacterium]|nr:class I SAM-dependent methyltransferase [Bryobacteraceae bacterium]